MLNRIIGSIFLISGTSIGAGMLGLPIKTLGINFKTTIIMFLIVWLIIITSAMAMLEISLWEKSDSNIISISKNLIGTNFSKLIAISYILFLYALITAYISGGSTMILDLININNNLISNLIFILPFAIIIFFGIKLVDHINKILFTLLIISYISLTFKVINQLNLNANDYNFLDNKMIIFSMPIIITSFGYNLLIPSIKTYLMSNKRIIVITIIIGSIIPLIVYIMWEYIIYCFFMEIGNKLFIKILFGEGNQTENLIMLMSNNKQILYFISSFSFFALTSSLIGVTISTYDFFIDLLNINKKSIKERILITLLVFTTPILLNIIYPYAFMLALSYAGVFASILLIIFPIYILWYGRYIKKIKYKYIILNNKIILAIILYIAILIIFIDIIEKIYFKI